jgi:hypothetical protein
MITMVITAQMNTKILRPLRASDQHVSFAGIFHQLEHAEHAQHPDHHQIVAADQQRQTGGHDRQQVDEAEEAVGITPRTSNHPQPQQVFRRKQDRENP